MDPFGRRPVELLRRVTTARRRNEDRPIFLDGLFLGAMVGAAIAGSTLWARWREGRARRSGAMVVARSAIARSEGEEPRP